MDVLDEIPFELDVDTVLARTRMPPGTAEAEELKALVEQTRAVARPKAICRECYIQARGEDTVTIEGVMFTSRALRANLDKPERVFAYIATCGREVAETPVPPGDFLKEFWLDAIKAILLSASRSHLMSHLQTRYALGKTTRMNPGSGDAAVWPIEQQRELFSLFGDVEALIDVRLTDSYLMVPNKTVSGIVFSTEIDFRTCQLCHREDCPGRTAPFDRALWDAIGPGTERAGAH